VYDGIDGRLLKLEVIENSALPVNSGLPHVRILSGEILTGIEANSVRIKAMCWNDDRHPLTNAIEITVNKST
jgi:hypothetical protein